MPTAATCRSSGMRSTKERSILKGQPSSGNVPRAKSVSSKPPHSQTRTRKPSVIPAPPLSSTSAVYKTNSDTSLANGLKKLNLNGPDKATTANGARSQPSRQPHPPPRRRTNSAGSGCKTLQDVAQYILDKRAKNIVVMAGAGISTSSGIPDFRTPGTGLYDNLKQYKIPQPEAIFDIDYFESYPRPFYTLAKEIYPNGRYRPNLIHYFLRLLHEQGVLLRIYTQNIDGLERLAGIPTEKLVEAHGNFQTVSCIRCKQKHDTQQIQNAIFADKLPRCMKNGCMGLVKPDIVFFGEDLPRRFYYYLKDFPQADMLLVMGTSLKVEPFADIVDSVRFYVPRVLFNRHAVGPFQKKRRMNDVVANGDIVERLKGFVELLGWQGKLKALLAEHEPSQLQEPPHESDKSPTDQSDDATKSSDTETARCPSVSSVSSKSSTKSSVTSTKASGSSRIDDLSRLPRRQTLPRPVARSNKTDVAMGNKMMHANNTRMSPGKPPARKGPTSLPRIGHKLPPFHTQRSLFRTNNPRLMPSSDTSSEQSSESSSSDDD